jgi:hypothetical protein
VNESLLVTSAEVGARQDSFKQLSRGMLRGRLREVRPRREVTMEVPVPDPRVAVIAGAAAGLLSPPVRRVVGKGVGYAARGVLVAGRPVVTAGRDIYDTARDVAAPSGGRKSARKTPAAA